MRIAITADVHLRPEYRERFDTLESVLADLVKEGITTLIVAGDLFDAGYEGYIELDALLKRHADFNLLIVPGNHDPDIDQAKFSAGNIRVVSSPAVEEIDGKQFLLLPYRDGETIGGVIEKSAPVNELKRGQWYLISHGDYGRINRSESGNEGGYFPLTRGDILRYQPRRVILGHIHAPNSLDAEVVYPGSPYPLDINETGQRRILILDVSSGALESRPLTQTPVYLQKKLFIIPDTREKEQIGEQLNEFFGESAANYEGENFFEKLTVRLFLAGYTTSREGIEGYISDFCRERGITVDKIDLDSLRVADDESLNRIALRTKEKIRELELDYDSADELRALILQRAYDIIYEG